MQAFFFIGFAVAVYMVTTLVNNPINPDATQLMDGTPVLITGHKGDYYIVVPRTDSLPGPSVSGAYAVHRSLVKK
jgi:hypothetical protein